MKRNKLWSFALAGALAVSNLSAVAMPIAGITASAAVKSVVAPGAVTFDFDAGEMTDAYISGATVGQGTKGVSKQFTVTVNLNDQDKYAGANDGARIIASAAAGDTTLNRVKAVALYKGNTLIAYSDVIGYVAATGASTSRLLTVTTDATAAAAANVNKVDDLGGTYKIQAYVVQNDEDANIDAGTGAVTNKIPSTMAGLVPLDTTEEFTMVSVREDATTSLDVTGAADAEKDATRTTFAAGTTTATQYNVSTTYLVKGDDYTVVGSGNATAKYTLNGKDVYKNGDTISGIEKDTVLTYITTNLSTCTLTFDSATLGLTATADAGAYVGRTYKLPDYSQYDGIIGAADAEPKIFKGWSENAAGTGTLIPGGTEVEVIGAKTYYSVWQDGAVVVFKDATGAVDLKDDGVPHINVLRGTSNAIKLPSYDNYKSTTKINKGWLVGVAGKAFDVNDSLSYTDAKALQTGGTWDATALIGANEVKDAVVGTNTEIIEAVVNEANGYAIRFNDGSANVAAYTLDARTRQRWTLAGFTAADYPFGLSVKQANVKASLLAQVGEYGKTITLNANPFKTNTDKWEFIGWTLASDATNLGAGIATFKDGQTVTIGKDVKNNDVLVAIWQPVEAIKVTEISNSQASGNYANTESRDEWVFKGLEGKLGANIFAWTGHKFLGWSTNQDATKAEYENKGTVKFTEDTVLYGVWEDIAAKKAADEAASKKAADEAKSAEEAKKGIPAGTTKKVSNVTYKGIDGTTVQVTKTPNKKTVTIKKTVTVDGKTLQVTKIGTKAVTGKKVKNVTIDATYIKKAGNISSKMFDGAKNLTKVTIKGAKKNSAVAKKIVKAAKRVNKDVKIVYK